MTSASRSSAFPGYAYRAAGDSPEGSAAPAWGTGPGTAVWMERESGLRAAIAGMARREEPALRAFYDTTVSRVYGLALRITRTTASAEDVVAEVYHQSWRDAGRFDPTRGSALTWLLTMCRSRAIDHLRRRDAAELHEDPESLTEAPFDDAHDPQNLLLAVERDGALYVALETLTPIQRQMVALAFFRGLSHQEIADHSRMPLGTVKTHIRKALEVLRAALEPHPAGMERT
jgi:RNA polymerase sigma factor (sigma-70 family)